HGSGSAAPATTGAAPPLHLAAGAATTPSPAAALTQGGVPVAVRRALAAAGGSVSVAVYDAVSGRSWTLDDRSGQVEASVSKLQILGAWLRDEQAGRAASARVTANLHAMIASSSNTAADAIFALVGRSGLTAFTGKLGVTVGADGRGHFGLDTSSAADQVTIMRAFVYPNAVLTDASRAEADTLLESVEDDQHWGVSGGVPAGVDVDLKNGWLPLGSGWVVNSVGHVDGAGHDYVVAILSSGNRTEQAGIARLQAVSAAVWATSATEPSTAS
ncbi:MAG: serine hydrolase, partial [Mycobacteriales bacterium]